MTYSLGIGTLTGSIVSRNRAWPLRWITPLAFLGLSAAQFTPRTARNLNAYVCELQDRYSPRSAKWRDELIAQAHHQAEWLRDLKSRIDRKTRDSVREAGAAVGSYSGLNVGTSRRSGD